MTRRDDDVSLHLLREMMQQNDEKHEAAHTRMRLDHRELKEGHDALHDRVATLDRSLLALTTAVSASQNAPIDVGKIVFNPRMVIAVVGLAATIVTGNWLTNRQATEEVRGLRTDLSVLKTDMAANTKLQDERASSQKTMLDKLDSKSTLQQMKIDEITTALKVRGIIK